MPPDVEGSAGVAVFRFLPHTGFEQLEVFLPSVICQKTAGFVFMIIKIILCEKSPVERVEHHRIDNDSKLFYEIVDECRIALVFSMEVAEVRIQSF